MLIGASLSEPHTRVEAFASVLPCTHEWSFITTMLGSYPVYKIGMTGYVSTSCLTCACRCSFSTGHKYGRRVYGGDGTIHVG